MSYNPLSAPWMALFYLGLFALFVAGDALLLWSRRSAFPGGARRLGWAIFIAAGGRLAILTLTLFVPIVLALSAGAAAHLPEMAGYVIAAAVSFAGVWYGGRLEVAIVRQLASPLLFDRLDFLANAPTKHEAR